MKEKGNNVYEENNLVVIEAYRALRANVQFYGCKDNIKTITITSCNPGDGKTATAINLAISMASTGKKVLLIDTDLRKPSIMKRLVNCSSTGLSDLISGHAIPEEAVNATNIKNLYFIGCGPIPLNPTEILESRRFAELLCEFKQEYDMVILDTPHLGSVIDSAVVASKTDGVLLVVKSKSVALQSAQLAKEQLEKSGARLLGAVLNKIPKDDYKELYNHYNYYKSLDKKICFFRWLNKFSLSRKVDK